MGCICPDLNILWRFTVRKANADGLDVRNLSCTVLGVLHGPCIWGTPLGCAVLFLGSSLREGTLPVRWRRILPVLAGGYMTKYGSHGCSA